MFWNRSVKIYIKELNNTNEMQKCDIWIFCCLANFDWKNLIEKGRYGVICFWLSKSSHNFNEQIVGWEASRKQLAKNPKSRIEDPLKYFSDKP